MTWGTTEYQYTIHALGAVEASMDYGAVNATDYISVGLLQWYAQRAANVLSTMRSTNPSDWDASLIPALDADLTTYATTDAFWSTRSVSLKERQGLHTIMSTTANKAVQDAQAITDIDNDYLPSAAALGMDKDNNSQAVAFFINIYNRNPVGARRIVGNAGASSSLDRLYAYTRNDQTESQYASRYALAYQIIHDMDTTGVGTGTTSGTPPSTGGNGGGGTNGSIPVGKASYVTQRGHLLFLINKDGTQQAAFTLVKPNYWLASQDANAGVEPPPSGGGSTPPTAITDMITWLNAHLDAFTYSQAGGRTNPPASGYTDCSGLMYYVYLTFADLDIGTWTGTQTLNATPHPPNPGTVVTTDPSVATDGTTLVPGDLVFYKWDSGSPPTFDHVAMFIGSDQVISHGGPDPGPDVESHSGNVGAAYAIQVRRYL